MQLVLFVFIILGNLSAISTFRCYTCSSTRRSSCADPFDPNNFTSADISGQLPNGGVCLKTKFDFGGDLELNRSAALDATPCFGGENGCYRIAVGIRIGEVCCCTSDLCNGVSTLRQQPLFSIVCIIMGIFTKFTHD